MQWFRDEEIGHLFACLGQAGCNDELEDAKEDEEDARHHPHIQLCHVGHPDERHIYMLGLFSFIVKIMITKGGRCMLPSAFTLCQTAPCRTPWSLWPPSGWLWRSKRMIGTLDIIWFIIYLSFINASASSIGTNSNFANEGHIGWGQ